VTPATAPAAGIGRVLLVRDGQGLAELAEAIRRGSAPNSLRLEEMESVYDALVELAASLEGEAPPVRSLAISLRVCGDDAAGVLEAIRRIDSHVRLVLLAPRGAAAVAAEAGFDDVVLLPAGSADLAAALQITTETAEGRSGRRGPVERIGPAQGEPTQLEAHALEVQEAARQPMRNDRHSLAQATIPFAGERDVVEMVIDDAMQAFAARRERPLPQASDVAVAPSVPAPPDNEALGDTDLVDAVLDGSDRLVAMALRLIRNELHCEELHLAPASELTREERPGETRVAVRWRSNTLGCLIAPSGTQSVAAANLQPWADWLGHWVRLDRAHEELRILAWTDELTGAGNRRAFERVLEQTVAEARNERRSVSIMYFDIDNFKSYNDRFGHDAGDEVLREVVELLRAVIRRGDHVFRVGGDEFVVIFADSRGPGTAGAALESVETIAHRFRDRVCELKLPQLGIDGPGTVSISAGVAMYPWDGHDARGLLAHADQLALQSKRGGKNTITFGPGARDHCNET
jgi:diguanylate cyclase (GGDEF)-like protein